MITYLIFIKFCLWFAESGKKAFNDGDGTKVLYGIATEMVDRSSEYYSFMISMVLHFKFIVLKTLPSLTKAWLKLLKWDQIMQILHFMPDLTSADPWPWCITFDLVNIQRNSHCVFVTHHIKTGQLSVECISRCYSICMGKNKENKKKLRLIFDHKIAMLHPITNEWYHLWVNKMLFQIKGISHFSW